MCTILKCSQARVERLHVVQVSSAQLTNKEEKYAILKMPSGELRKVLINCYATVGVISNSDHNLQSMGKAGRNRWRGIRPRNTWCCDEPG